MSGTPRRKSALRRRVINTPTEPFSKGRRLRSALPFRVNPATRHFPPPWTIEELDGGFKVVDGNGQTLAYVYGHVDQHDAAIAKSLTLDEARRIASNIAKLPTLLGKRGGGFGRQERGSNVTPNRICGKPCGCGH